MEQSKLNITECLYHMFAYFPSNKEVYTCTVTAINGDSINENLHMDGKSNENVETVRFMRTKNFTEIPTGIKEIFPNIESIIIDDCSLINNLNRENFKQLKGLKEIIIQHSPITHLLGRIFKDLHQLECVVFNATKLTTIDANIFDNLKNLKAVYFINNPCINASFVSGDFPEADSFGPHIKAPSIDGMKQIIKGCSPCDSVCRDLKVLLANDELKNFTITVKCGINCRKKCPSEVIRAHKFLIIARCSVLANLIRDKSDGKNLNLIGISAYTMKKIVEYFYTGIFPSTANDSRLKVKDLLSLAEKLELKELKKFARSEMEMNADASNELDIREEHYSDAIDRMSELSAKDHETKVKVGKNETPLQKSTDDFIQVEAKDVEDQFEIIEDFYDEVCSSD